MLTIAGFQQWSFLLSILLGAAAQTAFRLGKRYYKYKIQAEESNTETAELIVNDSEGPDCRRTTLTVHPNLASPEPATLSICR